MARSYRDKAGRRAENAVTVIRDALRQRNTHAALNEAIFALQSEAAKVRTRRPADGALIDAQLAGLLAAWVDRLPTYRPPGYASPLEAFAASLEHESGVSAHG